MGVFLLLAVISVDNTTIWTPDFNRDYYMDMLFAEGEDVNSMREYYIEQSSDRYTVYGIDTPTVTSEITVEAGKIKMLNFSWCEDPLADLQTTPFVTQEDLIGIWTVGTLMQINADGTLRVAGKTSDLDLLVSEEHPGSQEEWSYDGMVITLRVLVLIFEETVYMPPILVSNLYY